jgi:hypothetical protein
MCGSYSVIMGIKMVLWCHSHTAGIRVDMTIFVDGEWERVEKEC